MITFVDPTNYDFNKLHTQVLNTVTQSYTPEQKVFVCVKMMCVLEDMGGYIHITSDDDCNLMFQENSLHKEVEMDVEISEAIPLMIDTSDTIWELIDPQSWFEFQKNWVPENCTDKDFKKDVETSEKPAPKKTSTTKQKTKEAEWFDDYYDIVDLTLSDSES